MGDEYYNLIYENYVLVYIMCMWFYVSYVIEILNDVCVKLYVWVLLVGIFVKELFRIKYIRYIFVCCVFKI